jgi:hypothetical protein
MAEYVWTVIGAGPAGIATVGRLLDHGIEPDEIAWIDPEFTVGDFGTRWRGVSSNTRVAGFLNYLAASPAFCFAEAPRFDLHDLDPELTCQLGLVADPLMWVLGRLAEQVKTHRTFATELRLHQRHWIVTTEEGNLTSSNVVLAVGATPKTLDHPGLEEIPLEVAVDPKKLARQALDAATVAVFGSSHSTMLVLQNLLATPAVKVVNFYLEPHKYAVEFEDWTLFDDSGLKGQAARWARENIDGVQPRRLQRCLVGSAGCDELLNQCDRVVYTVGFERRRLPLTPQWGRLQHNAANGIIAPGLFGIGIAFPGYRIDPMGYGEHRVGLQKFMCDLNESLPVWLRYGT